MEEITVTDNNFFSKHFVGNKTLLCLRYNVILRLGCVVGGGRERFQCPGAGLHQLQPMIKHLGLFVPAGCLTTGHSRDIYALEMDKGYK